MALADLPPELVGHIADCLNCADILNLRLTCQRLHEKSLSTFATTFFSTITLDLCPKPLRRLHRIALDDFLRLHVRQVVIRDDWASLMVELVLRAQSLRKLSIYDAPAEFYRRLAAEPADMLSPPLKILKLNRFEGSSKTLISFVSRFGSTLEHLYLFVMRLGSPEGWQTSLANWAADLRQLKSFGWMLSFADMILMGREEWYRLIASWSGKGPPVQATCGLPEG
ncbi:hypothetical protein QBC43DRAFT_312729 [Cladorrhinum sp. PSN259]|nr:hypothetical protein QBC43DRAFT_312729 [Cladorrhinum sp. PSN259]